MSAASEYLTFIHRFSRSLQCELRVKNEPPAKGTCAQLSLEWTGRFKPKHLPEYRQWILSVHQHLCEKWQSKILYALGTQHNRTEFWQFEPGIPPNLS
jgi:hypothetical protein